MLPVLFFFYSIRGSPDETSIRKSLATDSIQELMMAGVFRAANNKPPFSESDHVMLSRAGVTYDVDAISADGKIYPSALSPDGHTVGLKFEYGGGFHHCGVIIMTSRYFPPKGAYKYTPLQANIWYYSE
jgi:hypothetical protein